MELFGENWIWHYWEQILLAVRPGLKLGACKVQSSNHSNCHFHYKLNTRSLCSTSPSIQCTMISFNRNQPLYSSLQFQCWVGVTLDLYYCYHNFIQNLMVTQNNFQNVNISLCSVYMLQVKFDFSLNFLNLGWFSISFDS